MFEVKKKPNNYKIQTFFPFSFKYKQSISKYFNNCILKNNLVMLGEYQSIRYLK